MIWLEYYHNTVILESIMIFIPGVCVCGWVGVGVGGCIIPSYLQEAKDSLPQFFPHNSLSR